jgi:hypothetical protein
MKDISEYAVIEDWFLFVKNDNPYLAPERIGVSFRGIVFRSANHPDGDEIITSPIISWTPVLMRVEGENRVIEVFSTQSGTKYVLGGVSPDYEEKFPGAFKRVLKTVPRVEK